MKLQNFYKITFYDGAETERKYMCIVVKATNPKKAVLEFYAMHKGWFLRNAKIVKKVELLEVEVE